MLDQSFSAHNFCTIYNIENRKGHIELDDMPIDFRECVASIKQNKAKIQEIKNLAEEKRTDNDVLELEKAQSEWKTQSRMTPAAKVGLTPENKLFLTP